MSRRQSLAFGHWSRRGGRNAGHHLPLGSRHPSRDRSLPATVRHSYVDEDPESCVCPLIGLVARIKAPAYQRERRRGLAALAGSDPTGTNPDRMTGVMGFLRGLRQRQSRQAVPPGGGR